MGETVEADAREGVSKDCEVLDAAGSANRKTNVENSTSVRMLEVAVTTSEVSGEMRRPDQKDFGDGWRGKSGKSRPRICKGI